MTDTVTPAVTATCGPVWGNDVVTDGFGNSSTTYYLVKVYVVTNGIVASTASLSQAYQLAGSGTFDLSSTLPFSLGAVSPAGSVLGQNLTFTGTDTATGPWNFTGGLQNNGVAVPVLPINLATQVTGTLAASNLPATTGQCAGVQFSRGQASGGAENCATPPTFVASGASHAVGYVPDPGAAAGTTKFLREDATWVAPGGIPVTQGDLTGFTANTGPTTILTPGANGFYRFNCYIVETRAATTSSTLPNCQGQWQDVETSQNQFFSVGSTNNTNAVGAVSQGNNIVMNAKSGQPIAFQTLTYVSSGATTMQYSIHIRVEGPF